MPQPDPTYQNARREALVILVAWLASTAYCCSYAYLFGYQRAGRPLGADDIRPILGIPRWVFWGVMAPWAAFAAFTAWFAGTRMADDDLGDDRAAELDRDIAEAGALEGDGEGRDDARA